MRSLHAPPHLPKWMVENTSPYSPSSNEMGDYRGRTESNYDSGQDRISDETRRF